MCLLPGGVGVPRGRVGQRDHGVRAGGEAARDVQPPAGVVGGVGAEVAGRAGGRPGGPRRGRTASRRHRGASAIPAASASRAEHGPGDQRPGVQPGRDRDGCPADGGALPAGQERPPARLGRGEPARHPAERLRPGGQERRVGAPPTQRRAGREPDGQHHAAGHGPRQAQRDRAAAAGDAQPGRPGGAAERPPGQQRTARAERGQHHGGRHQAAEEVSQPRAHGPGH